MAEQVGSASTSASTQRQRREASPGPGQEPGGQDPLELVVIGAGPRGLSVLERLAAHLLAHPGRSVRLHSVDPFPPGPGHVWRTDQSRLYLMNTPSFFPTVVPTPATVASASVPGSPEASAAATNDSASAFPPPVPGLDGLSFDAWRARAAQDPESAARELSAEDREEVERLGRADFPSRRIYGAYLAEVRARLLGELPSGLEVRHHAQEAVAVRRAQEQGDSSAPQGDHRFRVELGDGTVLAADAVVLALGHTDARLRPDQQDLVDFAAREGLAYWPPAVPADVRWDQLPAGQDVLVRGMGLNFHDVLAQLTEGRGGTFSADPEHPHRLVYAPSGQEPMVWVGSRRGTPYRAKAVLETYTPVGVENRFFTVERVDRIRAAAEAAGTVPDFEAEYWPLIRKDAQWNYYRTLVRTAPELVQGDPQEFLERLEEILTAEDGAGQDDAGWWARLDRLATERVAPGAVLRPERLTRPFEGESFDSHEAYAAALVHFLDRDVEAAFAGEDSPIKMAIGSLNQARTVAKHAVRDHGITGDSWLRGLERRFAALADGLASGPPVLRIQQMAAVARAGLLRFLGPDPVFAADEAAGRFAASSPWVRDAPVHADWLVEALAPANDVRASTSPLLAELFREGLARPWPVRTEDAAAPLPGKGLAVTRSPYRPLDAEDRPVEGLYVLGLQLSSAQWGTAIAAEADASLNLSASTLADADAIVKEILA